MEFLYAYYNGLTGLGFWGYAVVTLLWMHVTLVGITLYFHREQAHRSVDLHPALRHFFRFWLWMNTGAPTKEWVAVHRKHHAFTEREGDPHSPRVFGLKKVLLEGAELYRVEAASQETLDKYGKGTPNDWMERNVYSRFTYSGIALLVVTDLVLFGVPGIIMIAFQLATMPAMAAGIINGLCHAKGYRNFETDDSSTNLWPFALLVAGEELHNNHHAFPTSAKFSLRAHEIDVGWMYLKLFSLFGLARVRRIATPPAVDIAAVAKTGPAAAADGAPTVPAALAADASAAPAAGCTDISAELDALRAVIVNRMYVLRHYRQHVTLPVLRRELEALGDNANSVVAKVRSWLSWQPHMLDTEARERLEQLRRQHPSFETVLQFRAELKSLWEGAHTSNERLLADFREWCARAEASGIQGLQDFAAYLKSFQPAPSPGAA